MPTDDLPPHTPEPERTRESGDHLLDACKLTEAWMAERRRADVAEARLKGMQDAVLGSGDVSDDDLDRAFITEADRLFGNPGRISYHHGDVLFQEGEEADGLWVVVSGSVELFRSIHGEDVLFYVEPCGRLVGLMSLSQGGPAFFSCRAVGGVQILHLTRRMLDEAVMTSPHFGGLLVTAILRSLGRRNRQAARLLLDIHSLNQKLAARKDQLENALADLSAAQERLVEAGKMATLGNLTAGMAHELNNPATALLRASEWLHNDLLELLGDETVAGQTMSLGYARKPLSTRDERSLREDMTKKLAGDRALASALVSSGVTDGETLDRLLAMSHGISGGSLMDAVERGGRVGASLRGIESCARRISRLADSLKLYARNDEKQIDHVDINDTLEDVLLIVADRLRGLNIHKEYGTPPAVSGIRSEIEQVWTNLIINAAQAMEAGGVLRIRTMEGEPGYARVEVEDNGSGIPEEIQGCVFENKFTTKSGRVEFGLGLGLPICQSIVTRHGGRIGFTSKPGRTVFHTDLPTAFPTQPQV